MSNEISGFLRQTGVSDRWLQELDEFGFVDRRGVARVLSRVAGRIWPDHLTKSENTRSTKIEFSKRKVNKKGRK